MSNEHTPSDQVIDDNRLIAERRGKLGQLREAGEAYPNDFRPDTLAADVHQRYADVEQDELAAIEQSYALAGRMLAKRVMGKIAFIQIQDRSGRIQFVVQRDQLPEGVFQQFKSWDVGDLVAGVVDGEV